MFIGTLIAPDHLSFGDATAAEDALRDEGLRPLGCRWVEPTRACDVAFEGSATKGMTALRRLGGPIDFVVQAEGGRRRRILVADMDSTVIEVECLDELAGYAGLKDRIATVTERAMRGEIAFDEALRERVALLEGLTSETLDLCYRERVTLTPGAEVLVRTMRRNGAYCLLVSGGFSHFAEKVAKAAGFHKAISNSLDIVDGKLAGTVAGAIVGAEAKKQALIDAAAERGLDAAAALAVGDGANDIPMLDAAGLGIAYRAKPKVAEAADARIVHNDLSALLFAQGYARKDWASLSD